MKIKKNLIYKLFSTVTIFCLSWAILTSLFYPRIGKIFSIFRAEHSYKIIIILNLICFFISIFVLLAIKYFIKKKAGEKDLSNLKALIILIVELIIYSILMILFINFVGFKNPVDDTRITLNYLDQLNQGKQFGFDYMYSNPQNLMLMYLFKCIKAVFGNSYAAIMYTFIFFHCCTILLTFLSLKNLRISNKVSLISIQILFFAIQISLHVPVAYTDALSLLFISTSLFFFSKFTSKRNLSKNYDTISITYLIMTCIFTSIGFISKGTLLILIIALCSYLVFSEIKYRKFFALIPIFFMLTFNFGWNKFIQNQQIFRDNNYGQPNTHYLMMGLSNTPIPNNLSQQQKHEWIVGTYNSNDQNYSWDLFLKQRLPKKEIQKRQIDVTVQRFRSMTLIEKLQALNCKVAVTWSSGDLKSSFEWELGVNKSQNRLAIFTHKISGLFFYCWMMVIQYIIYVGSILSVAKYFNNKNSLIYFTNIFITGYFFFLLIWESSPRYAMGIFIPAILMIGLFSSNEKNLNSKIANL